MPKSPSQVYNGLAGQKHGIPQFTPEPSQNLPAEYRALGVSIGDVGVWRDGAFEFLFSSCLPATHPINHANGVPPDFSGFPLCPCDVSQRPYHSAGSIIASTKVAQVALEISGSSVIPCVLFEFKLDRELMWSSVFPTTLGSSLTLKFESTEGALLVLPDGASRQNLLPMKSFRAYVQDNASQWYRFASDWLPSSDSLFVVTGCDKAASWAIATASATTATIGISLKLSVVGLTEGTLAPKYQWKDFGSATVRTSQPCDNSSAMENQCIFIRGFIVPRSIPLVSFVAERMRRLGRAMSLRDQDRIRDCGFRVRPANSHIGQARKVLSKEPMNEIDEPQADEE
ncbi:hypothetical protein R3P38DRAFT_1610806 [Favolaschia claudopus]|uniref:Uncharacterized protein n=1 Tax=Favolaschia claudopus TaxID=2862362 RepID=A0AAW0AGN7_9AGAR